MGLFNFLQKKRHNKKIDNITNKTEINKMNIDHQKNSIDKKLIKENYQKTIFLYSQRKSKIKSNNDYPRYLIYHAEITNPKKYHEWMIKEGYFEAASINDVLNSFNVNQLKKILDDHGLTKTGNKQDLINRLIENNCDEFFNSISDDTKLYILSEKGNLFLNEHDDYLKLFKNQSWNISVFQYEEIKSKLNFNASLYDIAWGIFNSRLVKDEIYYLRNTYFNMYDLLMQENKKDQAIYFLLIVFYNDLSGISIYENIKMYLDCKKNKYNIYSKDDLIEHGELIKIAPGIIDRLVSLEEYYKEEMVDNIYSTYKLPINCCPSDLFKSIMRDIYNLPYLDKEYYQNKIKTNYIKYIKSL